MSNGGLDQEGMASLLERIAADIRLGGIRAVYVAIDSTRIGFASASTGFEPGRYRELMGLVADEAPRLVGVPGPRLKVVSDEEE